MLWETTYVITPFISSLFQQSQDFTKEAHGHGGGDADVRVCGPSDVFS